MQPRVFVLLVAILVALVGCGGDDNTATNASSTASTQAPEPETAAEFALRSRAFSNGDPIPKVFTCDGANTSPPLAWSDVPDGTAQLALIVDDPDAPNGNFVHWVMWGVGPGNGSVAAGEVPPNAVEGKNGAGQVGYIGPCPPSGVHHYKFQLYALSAAPKATTGADAQQLRDAIAGITIASTTLTGTYVRA